MNFPKEDIQKSLHVAGQGALDGKTKFATIDELKNLGAGNYKAFSYYNKMIVIVDETEKLYIWKEVSENEVGILENGFQYPANTSTSDFDYSNKTFNFFEYSLKSNQDNKTKVIALKKTVTEVISLEGQQTIVERPISAVVSSLDFNVAEDQNLYFKGQKAIYDYTNMDRYVDKIYTETKYLSAEENAIRVKPKIKLTYIDCIWRFNLGAGNYVAGEEINDFVEENFLLVEKDSLGSTLSYNENGVQLIEINNTNLENPASAFNSEQRTVEDKDVLVKIYKTLTDSSVQFTLWRFTGEPGVWGGQAGNTAENSDFILTEGINQSQDSSDQNNIVRDVDLGTFLNDNLKVETAMASFYGQSVPFTLGDTQNAYIFYSAIASVNGNAVLVSKKYDWKPGKGDNFTSFSSNYFTEVLSKSQNLKANAGTIQLVSIQMENPDLFETTALTRQNINSLLNTQSIDPLNFTGDTVFVNVYSNTEKTALYHFTGETGENVVYDQNNNFTTDSEFIYIDRYGSNSSGNNLSDFNNDLGFISEAVVPEGKFLIFKRNGSQQITGGADAVEFGDYVMGIVEGVLISGVYNTDGNKTALASFDIYERKEFN